MVVDKIGGAPPKLYTTTMYVRWQSYKRRSKFWEGEPRWVLHWRAILVESKRVDGMPRQIHVAYLGGFIRHDLKRVEGRVRLWEGVERCLDKLGNRVSADDRKRIVVALAKKAGEPPTRAERIAAHRKSAEFFFGTDDELYEVHRAALEAWAYPDFHLPVRSGLRRLGRNSFMGRRSKSKILGTLAADGSGGRPQAR
jgi:hypothetical protein